MIASIGVGLLVFIFKLAKTSQTLNGIFTNGVATKILKLA
jgi:hypothetical protein